jgi:tetratricopeptide (TPR) repeat protein
MSLNNLANILSELGRREEALDKAQEAVRIYEQLAKARPDAFLPDLAMSLHNLANTLMDLGRREEALDKAQKAVRIYEPLAKARPDAFLPKLATSYGTLSAILWRMERHAEAAATYAQGIRAITPLFQKLPMAFAKLVGSLCTDYHHEIQQAHLQPDEKLLAPVVEVFDKLKKTNPRADCG